MTKQIITAVLMFSSVALAADKAPAKRCTFETLEDGRTKITCPRAPVVKEEK